MITMAGSMKEAGRQAGPWRAAEGLHLMHKREAEGELMGNGVGFRQGRSHLLILPKQCHKLGTKHLNIGA